MPSAFRIPLRSGFFELTILDSKEQCLVYWNTLTEVKVELCVVFNIFTILENIKLRQNSISRFIMVFPAPHQKTKQIGLLNKNVLAKSETLLLYYLANDIYVFGSWCAPHCSDWRLWIGALAYARKLQILRRKIRLSYFNGHDCNRQNKDIRREFCVCSTGVSIELRSEEILSLISSASTFLTWLIFFPYENGYN